MQTSIFIAKIFGLMYLVFGLGVLFNGAFYRKLLDEFTKSVAHLYWGGIFALLAGFLIVNYHNVWEGDWWVVLITILGWIGLLKGFLLIVFPKAIVSWTKAWTKAKNFLPIWGVIILIIGLIFGYYGFVA